VFYYPLDIDYLTDCLILIQADFLLNAAREDILTNDWNQALLNALAECFHVAVKEIQSHGCLRLAVRLARLLTESAHQ
jgi:hypothetical protein